MHDFWGSGCYDFDTGTPENQIMTSFSIVDFFAMDSGGTFPFNQKGGPDSSGPPISEKLYD
jgi:hypothetical protein